SAVFVLDVSGSMQGDRLNQLKTALRALTGTDQSVTGQFARFRARESVTFIVFNNGIVDQREFTIDDTNPNGADMQAIPDYVDGLSAGGGTAIWSAMSSAYDQVEKIEAAAPDNLVSVVLMTDGENTAGESLDDFRNGYAGRSDAVRAVRTFPILFGEGDSSDL